MCILDSYLSHTVRHADAAASGAFLREVMISEEPAGQLVI